MEAVEANTGAAAGGREQQLLDIASRWDDAYFNGDVEALKALMSPDIVQHADRIATEKDRQGPEEVARFFGKYFANYRYKHFPVVRAVNPDTGSVYCLWDDEDVIMRPESFDEALPASGSVTSLSGCWRLVVDGQQRVSEIWCLRQLTREEKKFLLKHRPSQLYSDFRAKSLVGPTLDLGEQQVAKMHAAAEAFNEAWKSGDVRRVHELLAPGCHTVSPIFGDTKGSREEWEEMVRSVFQYWEVHSNQVDIAVTPSSNKAFIWWEVRGVQKDTQQENDIFGLNVLVFDPRQSMLVTEVVGFRQPLQSEHDHVMKAESYQERLAEAK